MEPQITLPFMSNQDPLTRTTTRMSRGFMVFVIYPFAHTAIIKSTDRQREDSFRQLPRQGVCCLFW